MEDIQQIGNESFVIEVIRPEMIKWLAENIDDDYHLSPIRPGGLVAFGDEYFETGIAIYFEERTDAMAFKLKWM